MELKDFIKSAITDISQAVVQADDEIRELGGLVNPGTHTKQSSEFVAPRTTLDFDVAVSATGETSGDAGAKAKIFVVQASLGGKKTSKSEVISRLSFSLDVVLPHTRDQRERVGKVRLPNKKV